MKVSASEFKAKCLSLIDMVQAGGEVVITKRGRIVAKLIGDVSGDERPWLALRQTPVRWKGDPFTPAIDAADIEALK
jgi:prevent-host-death family protein